MVALSSQQSVPRHILTFRYCALFAFLSLVEPRQLNGSICWNFPNYRRHRHNECHIVRMLHTANSGCPITRPGTPSGRAPNPPTQSAAPIIIKSHARMNAMKCIRLHRKSIFTGQCIHHGQLGHRLLLRLQRLSGQWTRACILAARIRQFSARLSFQPCAHLNLIATEE